MAKRLYGLLGDVPVGEHHESRKTANKDGLDRGAFARVLARAAFETGDTLTIGVYGDWGEGKTSLMRLMKDEVDTSNKAVGVWFNAWQYEREDHLIVPLIATITRDIDLAMSKRQGKLAETFLAGAKSLRDALRAVAYGFSFKGKVDIPFLPGAEVGFSGKDMIERYQALVNDVSLEKSLYFEAFEKLRTLPGTGSHASKMPKIVVFIDDLDRCLPDAAVRLLENIKLVLSISSFSFVLGIAPTVIQKFVESKFSKELGLDTAYFRNYLDKFVQVPVRLPRKEDDGFETFIKALLNTDEVLNDEEKSAFAELTGLIAAISDHNPRSAVRFINQILVLNRITVEQDQEVPVADLAFASTLHAHRSAFLYGKLSFPEAIIKSETERKHASLDRPEIQELAQMGWPTYLQKEMAFREGLARLLECVFPNENAMDFAHRLKCLSKVQNYPQVVDALKWLAENIHICQALEQSKGLDWLLDESRLSGSFQLAVVVQNKSQPPESSSETEPDWDSIRKRVCEQKEDPLTIPEIQALIKEGNEIPRFAQPFVKDLTSLSKLTQLENVSLSDCSDVTDLTPLSKLTQLENVSLSHCSDVTDLTPLSKLTQLENVSLSECPSVTDLTPLSKLTQLESLYLSECPGVTDLTPLSKLTQLERLDLRGCPGVTDLTPLSELTQLESLYLSECPGVTDLAPLSKLTQLERLDLSECPGVTDLTPLSELTQLGYLNLRECPGVTDLAPLSGLVSLSQITLPDGKVIYGRAKIKKFLASRGGV